MSLLHHLRRQFVYDDWANRSVLTALRALDDPPDRATALLGHILAARRLWLDRLHRMPSTIAVWPSYDLDACADLLEAVSADWTEYLDLLTPPALAEPVRYTNSRGEVYENTAQDILSHVLAHGAYHRGQIAGTLRAAGHAPPYTDYIHAARRGHLD